MNKRVLLPFLALGALILVVSLACGPNTTTDNTGNTGNTGNTNTQPTYAPVATIAPQIQATQAAPAYFTEEFDVDFLDDWSYFITSGNDNDFSMTSGNDKLVFDIENPQVYTYLLYDPYTYTDVQLDVRATNRGQNTNNISFICRYTGTDWYEMAITNGGMWVLYYAKWDNNGVTASYSALNNGGADHTRVGKDTNDFTVTCIGNTITLYVNGYEEGSYRDRDYALSEGQVGIGVSSLDTYPIIIDFDYVTISEP